MISKEQLRAQLEHTLDNLDFEVNAEHIPGKVRESYLKDGRRVIVVSDRLSAFDRILTSIPYKGQVLNQIANHWFSATEHIVPNHLISTPHPNVVVSREVQILPVEIVVRGYLTGSAWRDYEAGETVSGEKIPAGMKRWQQFESPILTPSTKAGQGEHDIPISVKDIIEQGIVEEDIWTKASDIAHKLFSFGSSEAGKRGLILVDTKYEMGVLKDDSGKPQIILADEVHTPDSSRYWIAESYEERFSAGKAPRMLDKEFVRGPLIERGFMGDGEIPELSDEFRVEIAQRYIELYERICGIEFEAEPGSQASAIKETVKEAIEA